jgi:phosphodiesterase/alkaline phosphatase D-like protein
VRQLAVLAAVATLALAALSADAATPGFQYGVAAGEITSTSAVLWTRAPAPGSVRLLLTKTGRPRTTVVRNVAAERSNDLTASVRVTGLLPQAAYTYTFTQTGRPSPTGRFVTAPSASAVRRIRFAISGDADATPGPNGKPGFNRFEVYGRMAAEQNDFNVNLGDTIYSDSELAGAGVARTVPEKWGKYKLGLALAALQRLRASAGLYSHWDDHEFVNDFSRSESGDEIYSAGVGAFIDYAPVATPSAATGLYRTFRWGKNLELFFLDERTFRSAKAGDACNGDLAPTVPQAVRDAFAALAPGLRTPVAQSCLDALNDPSRTMLGARQYAAFTRAIAASTATWKVVVNEVPIQQFYALPYDRWEGYAAERERLLRFLQANVENVVFLTTDTHGNLVNEVRYRTFGSLEGSGIWEVVTGPVATNTFAKEIDGFLGQKGAGTAIGALFFKPQPPNGVGMRCAALDTYSYSEVTVTARRLTVAMKDAKGRPVREATGYACPPLVLTAR